MGVTNPSITINTTTTAPNDRDMMVQLYAWRSGGSAAAVVGAVHIGRSDGTSASLERLIWGTDASGAFDPAWATGQTIKFTGEGTSNSDIAQGAMTIMRFASSLMAGTLPPKLKALLDTLREANLPGDHGDAIRAQIDQVEAEVTDVMKRLERWPEIPPRGTAPSARVDLMPDRPLDWNAVVIGKGAAVPRRRSRVAPRIPCSRRWW